MLTRAIVFEERVYRGETSPPAMEDVSRYQNNGVITAAIWTQLPSKLWYLYYDGINDIVNYGNDDSLDISTGHFTLLGWFYPTGNASAFRHIATKRTGAGGWYTWYIYNDDKLALEWNGAGVYKSAASVSLNVWHFGAVGTRDVAGVRRAMVTLDEVVAVDGVSNLTAVDMSNNANFQTGYNSTFGNPLMGGIAKLRFFKGVSLTNAQIYAIYNAERSLFGV
ncbi:MAG: hypothetical protein KAR06_02945 [Deltaproteobacteria bacterium]|nr:hypothetical protein [Deltaproteobacteria bacterium]